MPFVRSLRLLILGLLIGSTTATAQTARPAPAPTPAQIEALHNDLRAVRDRLVQAVNQKNIVALTAELSPQVAFTAINNDTVTGIENVKAYFDRMMGGSSRFLNDFSIKVESDSLSTLYADNRVAVATGRADTFLDLRGGSGMKYTVPLRWTATLERTTGPWKLAAIHFSADLSDNPYLSALSTFWKWVAALIGIAGLGLGYLIAWKRGRAKQ